MPEHHITFPFTARYFTHGGDKLSSVSDIWFILHGQGQLARFFIKKFTDVSSATCKIVAPEGLSRYYLDGFYGKVGATWMTKEDRLIDIGNYIKYLDKIYKEVVPENGDIRVTLFGFSQGAATASRWVLSDHSKFHRLILWAGLFPPDLDFEKGREKMKGLEIYNIYGDKDKYLTDEREIEQFQNADRLGVELKTIRFAGGHEIDINVLQALI